MATEEGTHSAADGSKLYTKTWKAAGAAKARLAFIHGFSDHCNTYGILFPTLASQGIEVYAFDQRGWGRSVSNASQKGKTGSTNLVLDDIASFLKTLIPSPVPLFLMGHSMGGAEILCFAAQGPAEVRKHIRGYLAESPFIAIHPSSRPSEITVVLGRLASKVLPNMQRLSVLDEKLLSRDLQVQKDFVEDKLCHDTGTLAGLAGMLDRAAILESGKISIGDDAGEGGVTRIWISHGTKDMVCAFDPVKTLFDRLKVKDKEFKVYDGWYHKLHQEPSPDRETFAKDVGDWIMARTGDEFAAKPKL